MSKQTSLVARRLLALLGAAALAGCVSFGPKPPPSLMTLEPATAPASGTGGTVGENSAVTVIVPSYPQELATARVPVRTGTAVAYLKGVGWIDVPAKLFRALLADTITARTGRATLDEHEYHLAPGPRLGGRLVAFGFDASAMAAVVTFDALLQQADQPLRTQRFEARVPVSAISPASARAALNQAANQVAVQVADWVGR